MSTPFANLAQPPQELEKVALAKLIARGMSAGGKFMQSRGVQAGRNALAKTTEKLNLGRFGPTNEAQRAALAQASNKGQGMASFGRKLSGGAQALNESPGMQSAINYGGGGLLGAGALYGSNRMGHASGRFDGVNEGLDTGMMAGVQATLEQQQQNQPGYLGGIWNALKGDAGGGLDMQQVAGNAYGNLSAQRQQLIERLMGQKA